GGQRAQGGIAVTHNRPAGRGRDRRASVGESLRWRSGGCIRPTRSDHVECCWAIEPHLQRAEIERAQRKSTNDLGAYDYYLRGIKMLDQGLSHQAAEAAALLEESQALFAKAYGLDPEYAAAYGWAAFCAYVLYNDHQRASTAPEIVDGLRLARL